MRTTRHAKKVCFNKRKRNRRPARRRTQKTNERPGGARLGDKRKSRAGWAKVNDQAAQRRNIKTDAASASAPSAAFTCPVAKKQTAQKWSAPAALLCRKRCSEGETENAAMTITKTASKPASAGFATFRKSRTVHKHRTPGINHTVRRRASSNHVQQQRNCCPGIRAPSTRQTPTPAGAESARARRRSPETAGSPRVRARRNRVSSG